MRNLILIVMGLVSFSSFAESDLNHIECEEASTGLKIEGPVSQSKNEKWRYFAKLKSSNGLEKVYEMRGFDGFDSDTRRSFVGYTHRSTSGKFTYTIESGAGRPAEVTLVIKLPELTGQGSELKLTCP